MTVASYQRHLDSLPTNMKSSAQDLSPDAVVELFELELQDDAVPANRTVLYFKIDHTETYLGNQYNGMPCNLSGAAINTDGESSRPTLTLANIDATFSKAVAAGTLDRSVLTRRRVLVTDMLANTPESINHIWTVNRVVQLNRHQLAMELRDSSDGQNFEIPTRRFMPPEFTSVSLR